MIPRIGIALGDVTGIGPEVAMKALADPALRDVAEYVVIGDGRCVERTRRDLGLGGGLPTWVPGERGAGLTGLEPEGVRLPMEALPVGSAVAARAALRCLEAAARLCLDGRLDGMVTAPVNKQAIVLSGVPFVGQTEFLSALAGTPRTVMMLLGPDDRERWLRVALATTHLPLRQVADVLTTDRVGLAVGRSVAACEDLGLSRARVAVCGLNPHAGEGGAFGSEDAEVIAPAVRQAQAKGWDVVGPVPADTVFYQALRGDYDAVVAMYHDQGLGPLKLVAFENGVNWTLGLPFIRTSPDHGTAYDIAGRGVADAGSMRAAIRLAVELAGRRR